VIGFDQARPSPFVIVVEGPTDMAKQGPPCVGTLGQTVGHPQLDLLASTWGDRQAVIVMGDAGTRKDEVSRSTAEELSSRTKLTLIPHENASAGNASVKADGEALEIQAAARAAAFHSLWPSQVSESEHANDLPAIEFSRASLTCLLVLCDQLQVWDRETGSILPLIPSSSRGRPDVARRESWNRSTQEVSNAAKESSESSEAR